MRLASVLIFLGSARYACSEDEEDQRLYDFRWIREVGGDIHPGIAVEKHNHSSGTLRHGPREEAVYATRDIGKREILLSVPWSHMITALHYRGDTASQCQAIFMLRDELQLGKESHLSQWVVELLRVPLRLPFNWRRIIFEKIEHLNPYHWDVYVGHLKKECSQWNTHHSIDNSEIQNYTHIALEHFLSGNIPYHPAQERGHSYNQGYVIAPMIEYFHHREGKWASAEVTVNEYSGLVMRSTRAIKKGEQIYTSFGPEKTAQEFLRDYGYLPDEPVIWNVGMEYWIEIEDGEITRWSDPEPTLEEFLGLNSVDFDQLNHPHHDDYSYIDKVDQVRIELADGYRSLYKRALDMAKADLEKKRDEL